MVINDKNQIGFIHNSKVPNALELVKSLITDLKIPNAWVSSATELINFENEFNNTHAVIIVGGDGTILRTIRILNKFNVPVIGIKMGKIGFMAELTPENSYELLPKYLDNQLIDQNMILFSIRIIF